MPPDAPPLPAGITPPASDADRWQRLQEIFHAALFLDAEPRARLLSEACGGDDGLRTQVDRLLAAHERLDGVSEE